MTGPRLWKSPTPWLAAGMGLVVGVVMMLTGVFEGMEMSVRAAYEGRGLILEGEDVKDTPVAMVVMVLAVIGLVFAIEGTPGIERRVMLLVTALVVAGLASPVLAMWSVLWCPCVMMVALLWSGISAIVHAGHRDKEFEVVDGEKVISLSEEKNPRAREWRG